MIYKINSMYVALESIFLKYTNNNSAQTFEINKGSIWECKVTDHNMKEIGLKLLDNNPNVNRRVLLSFDELESYFTKVGESNEYL